MRILIPISLFIVVITSGLSAQEVEDSTYSKNKIYLYASKNNIVVIGKVVNFAILDIQLMNFTDDRYIKFDLELDNLFIVRFGSNIKAAKYDNDYIETKIYPNQQMYLHFYLPDKKNITKSELYYLTYNATMDTLILAPTLDSEIKLYVQRFEKQQDKKWYKKTAKFVLFVIASILALRLF